MVLFSLPFFMDISNGRLLQLFECIESTKCDVKKKITSKCACDPHTKVTIGVGGRSFEDSARKNPHLFTKKHPSLVHASAFLVVEEVSQPLCSKAARGM
jgi:hypothetical protein